MMFSRSRIQWIDLFLSVIMLIWFFIPLSIGPVPIQEVAAFETEGAIQEVSEQQVVHQPVVLYPFLQASQIVKFPNISIPFFLLLVIYLIPLFALFRIVSFFALSKTPLCQAESILQSMLRILATVLMVFFALIPALLFADSAAWFFTLPVISIVSFIIAFLMNIATVAIFMRLLSAKNPIWKEYAAFKKTVTEASLDARQKKAAAAIEVFFRIRTKLFVAFIGLISLILLVLSTVLLTSYQSTILKAVGDAAKNQVAQAAATYRISLGDSIAMFEFLNRQLKLNKNSEFNYTELAIYTNLKQEIYLDEHISLQASFPVEYSTKEPSLAYPKLSPLPLSFFEAFLAGDKHAENAFIVHNKDAKTISYVSPIIKIDTIRKGDQRIRRERLLGFSAITFDNRVIMRPYFQTRVSVIVFTALFMYLAIILTYVIGNYIVNPLLFLRMNVRKISDVLSEMINGTSRVSSNALIYTDCITSHDEIKSLSSEINDMVTVIRGIVPYISASTLKYAESGNTSTMRKDLAFLFTDIRGFTTLCEGMEPEEVVTILNSYLDLETEIILNNHGDVDKFVGDEMMAFFEGPLKEINACRAAMQIRHAMMQEKERREKAGLPIVAIGIGINVGPVVFGSVGARDRMDFTSIGDTVNLAARLEGANKAYGSKSLITETVYEQVKDEFLCRELDLITVKGKNEPVRIYEILQERTRALAKLIEITKHFEKGLAYYRKCKWDLSYSSFKKNVDLFDDAPSAVYLDRIEHFKNNPPPDNWDGVFKMTVK